MRQRSDEFLDGFVGFVGLAELVHDLGEALQRLALGHQHLATQQVEGLNAGGAFVQHRDAAVADVLLHAVLGDETVAAEDLHAVVGGLEADFGHERLGDRREEGQHRVGGFLLLFVLAALDDVDLLGGEVQHRAIAFGEGLHGQQHAAHVRMHDDRVGGLLGRLRTGQRAHLQTLASIGDAALETDFGMGQALQRGTQASGVHEGEHAVQALVRRADQEAGGGVEVHHAGGVAVDAHLVLDGTTGNRVALASVAFGVGQELRHDEQRDALGALRGVGQAGQDDMDDVVGHVVLAGGDEDLGAGDLVAAVGLRLGLGAQHAQVGAAVRLGQAHGAGPLAGDQLGQVGRLLLGGAVGMQGVHCAVGQARVHAPGPVGLADHLADGQAEGFRQPLAAVLDVMGQARPAAFDELLVGLLEAGRRLHAIGAPGAAFQVADAVQRSDHLFAELRTFLEDGVDHVGSRVFGARQALVVRFVAQQLVANETDITQGGLVIRHSSQPLRRVLVNRRPDGCPESAVAVRDRSRSPCRTHSCVPALKQAFETYVYANPLSSIRTDRSVMPEITGCNDHPKRFRLSQ